MTTHRRQFLRLCGVAGIGAIAGCSNGSQDSETPISSETTTGPQSPTATLTPTPNQPSTDTPTETGVSGTQQEKLFAGDSDSLDQFGQSVALSSDGSTALIGAIGDDDPNEGAGSAYVFESADGSWTQQAELAADDGEGGDLFGDSVALSSDGSTALIGAWGDENPNGREAGAAYAFERSGGSWTEQAKLAAGDSDSYAQFGHSVALSSDGSTALIGAPTAENANGEDVEAAYVFDGSGGTWSQQSKLIAKDGGGEDWFGLSVALSSDGSTALIGAIDDRGPNGDDAGSAHVFESADGSWTQQAKLAADDGDSGDEFGWSVALSSDGSTALVGARYDEDPNGMEAGSAYIFDGSGGSWTQQAKLAADDGDSSDLFGYSVALSSDGSTALIGARSDEDPNGMEAGSAYVFDNSAGSWTQQAKLAADDGEGGDQFGGSVAASSDASTVLIGVQGDDYLDSTLAGSAYVFE